MYRLILAGAMLVGAGVATPALTHAAEKAKKKEPAAKAPVREERPAPRRYKGDATNESIFTQQQTADSFAAKIGSAPTTQKGAASSDSPQLTSINSQIAAENQRHAAATESLIAALAEANKSGNSKETTKARKALDKEESAYQKKKASLEKQRQEILRKAAPANPAVTKSPKAVSKK